jgi:hypothetical protein
MSQPLSAFTAWQIAVALTQKQNEARGGDASAVILRGMKGAKDKAQQ